LPLRSVALTEEGGKIVIDKHPSTTRLARRQGAALGTAPNLLGMHLEERGSFVQREGLHGSKLRELQDGWPVIQA